MKRMIKNVGLVTKILLVALIITGVSVDTHAQKKKKKSKKEKQITRPANMGHAATDAFVKSSFDLYTKNRTLAKKLGDAASNADELGKMKTQLETQTKEAVGLLGKSAEVLKSAKAITPKTDSMKAVKNINSATKALNATKEAIPGQLEMIKTQSAAK